MLKAEVHMKRAFEDLDANPKTPAPSHPEAQKRRPIQTEEEGVDGEAANSTSRVHGSQIARGEQVAIA